MPLVSATGMPFYVCVRTICLHCVSFCKYGIKESVAEKEKQEEQIIMQSAKDVRDLQQKTGRKGCFAYKDEKGQHAFLGNREITPAFRAAAYYILVRRELL